MKVEGGEERWRGWGDEVGLVMTPGGVVGKEWHLRYSEGDC